MQILELFQRFFSGSNVCRPFWECLHTYQTCSICLSQHSPRPDVVDDEAGVAEILVCDSKGGTSRTANVLSVLFFIYICFFSHCWFLLSKTALEIFAIFKLMNKTWQGDTLLDQVPSPFTNPYSRDGQHGRETHE
jgi:hypothetical protein